MFVIRLLISLALATPAQVIRTVCVSAEKPRYEKGLRRIAHIESRTNPDIGIHERDERLPIRASFVAQIRMGHLHSECQTYRRGWGTRGMFGTSTVSNWKYMPTCSQPEWLDNIWYSTIVAFRKYDSECTSSPYPGWCHRPRRKTTPQ